MAVAELVREFSVDEALHTIRVNGKVHAKYDNFIGGKWVPPVKGKYFVDYSPINGEPNAEIAKSTPEDIEKALDAAHAAKDAWGRTSPAARAVILNQIADVMEANLETLAVAETMDNGKPIRETRNADVPLAIDHFRYFAACIRAEEGALSELDNDTVAYHFKEPLGVVGQIIPWNFPLLMAAWKLAPALGAGNCMVIKPASNTPLSLLVLAELISDFAAARRAQYGHRTRRRDRQSAGTKQRIAKIAFTGETTTGRLIMQYASENIVPQTLELGGKSPNIFFADMLDANDNVPGKAWKASPCLPSIRAKCALARRALCCRKRSTMNSWRRRGAREEDQGRQPARYRHHDGSPGFQGPDWKKSCVTSMSARRKAQSHDRRRTGAAARRSRKWLLRQPTVFVGHNKMRVFQEEIFGPVLSVTRFKTWKTPSDRQRHGVWPGRRRVVTQHIKFIVSAAKSRQDACGPIAITCIQRAQLSAATSNRDSAAKPTR